MRASVTHRTTTSAGRRGLPGAAVVAAAVALAGLLPAPAAGATTQTADACESVTALVAAALPGQALDLVAALRAGSPGPTGTTSGTTTTLGTDDAPVTVEESQSPASACATEAAVAAAAVDRAEERAREAVALVPTDARAARDAADEALAVDAENETAQGRRPPRTRRSPSPSPRSAGPGTPSSTGTSTPWGRPPSPRRSCSSCCSCSPVRSRA